MNFERKSPTRPKMAFCQMVWLHIFVQPYFKKINPMEILVSSTTE